MTNALYFVPFIGLTILAAARGEVRVDHFGALALLAILLYASPKTKNLLTAIYPVALVGALYDAMRPFKNVGLTAARVHVCDVRAVESALFGSGGNTIHDWFRVHHWPALDLVCAFPYGTFIIVSFACAAYLGFRDRAAMRRFTWAFFAMNIVGFVTYHVFPAAPPWYFHEHGCFVDLATHASEGPALARVDAMLGISYFHAMYAKASSVFGAIPSLHCAYPLLVALEGWRVFGRRLRVLAIAYWLLMVFASVYLDHHWLIDGILGSSLAFVTSRVLRRLEQPVPIPSIAAEAE
jgi:hypothetical protein